MAENPAPQVPAMVTSGASGQNVEVDRATIGPVTAGAALCDERLAGGSNPASAGPADTPLTNDFFASCEKVTGWNHVYSKQASFCRTIERKLGALQAKLDRVMLEHCPDEMTNEQRTEWAKHQKSATSEHGGDMDR